jgi:large conductance mechanosensitive channel
MKSFLNEFKAFAMRGNVVDLAIGVVIGAAFGKIVTSLVDDVVMPLIGVVTGGIDFTGLSWTLRAASGEGPAIVLKYGAFLNVVVNFLIIALAIFIVMKQMNRVMKKHEEAKAVEPPKPSNQEVLLTEIRDLLKK